MDHQQQGGEATSCHHHDAALFRPKLRFVSPKEFYILNGAAIEVQDRKGLLSCCAIPVTVVQPKNRSAPQQLSQRFIRFHLVNEDQAHIVNTRRRRSGAKRLAFGNIVYITCGRGHVLRGHSLFSRASWSRRKAVIPNTNDDENSSKSSILRDTKAHFKIVGGPAGQFLAAHHSFQLESVHWPDCKLATPIDTSEGGTTNLDNAYDEQQPEALSDSVFIKCIQIANCRKRNSKSRPLSLEGKPLKLQVPTVQQRKSTRCSRGYGQTTHRTNCDSYLRQSSSAMSSSNNNNAASLAPYEVVVSSTSA